MLRESTRFPMQTKCLERGIFRNRHCHNYFGWNDFVNNAWDLKNVTSFVIIKILKV